MDFNDSAARQQKFVKFTDLLQPWMQQHVNPFLEGLIGQGKVDEAQEIGNLMVTTFGGIQQELIDTTRGKKQELRAYVDVTANFKFADIWQHLVISPADPFITKAVTALAEAAGRIEDGQKEKILKGFDEVAAAASAVDVTSPQSTAKDFMTVFRQKNPFAVKDISRKPTRSRPA